TDTVRSAYFLESMLTHQDVRGILLARAFKPGRKVYAIADDGIFHTLGRADVAGDHHVGVEADSHIHALLAGRRAPGVPAAQLRDHGDGGADGAIFVIIVRKGHAEDGHDRVTDILVQHSTLLLNTLNHHREVFVEQADRP